MEIIIIGIYSTLQMVQSREERKDRQGEGGGGSGRIRFDCELKAGLSGVLGKGRLSLEIRFAGTTGRFRFCSYDWKVSPGGRIKLSLLERKPSPVVIISIS